LEDELGEELFIRSPRCVKLTAAGKRLLPAAQDLQRTWMRFVDDAKPRQRQLEGRIAVGTSAAATAFLWAAFYRGFGLDHPAVEMDLRTMAATQASIDGVQSGELDVAFVPLPLNLPGIDECVLGLQQALLCASPAHPLVGVARVTAEQLDGERFVIYENSMSIRWLADQFFKRERLRPKIVMESNDTHLLKAMVEVGYGIGFLPDWSIEREVAEGRLAVLPIAGKPLQQKLGVISRRRGSSKAGQAFVDYCKAHTHLLPPTAR
jgi:DNA-binding transcriptional LysR family regulator